MSDPEAAVSKALGTGRETYLNIRGDLPVHLVFSPPSRTSRARSGVSPTSTAAMRWSMPR
ncbi:hypothetical protein [Paracoccus mutanolyticus]|uniref:hypothetical protein n=1 Tax=Paracoccus mutanolyticus TaxID=1499308 RepID=UPI001CB9A3C6|nr:hypothetical protein [Paracoccus mutanolyticus]